MSDRWLEFDYVPRELHLPAATRRRIMKRALHDVEGRWRSVVFRVLQVAAFLVAIVALDSILRPYAYPTALVVAIAVVTWIGATFVGGKLVRPQVRRVTTTIGHPVCPRCDYDRRGTPEGPCPECGAPPAGTSRMDA